MKKWKKSYTILAVLLSLAVLTLCGFYGKKAYDKQQSREASTRRIDTIFSKMDKSKSWDERKSCITDLKKEYEKVKGKDFYNDTLDKAFKSSSQKMYSSFKKESDKDIDALTKTAKVALDKKDKEKIQESIDSWNDLLKDIQTCNKSFNFAKTWIKVQSFDDQINKTIDKNQKALDEIIAKEKKDAEAKKKKEEQKKVEQEKKQQEIVANEVAADNNQSAVGTSVNGEAGTNDGYASYDNGGYEEYDSSGYVDGGNYDSENGGISGNVDSNNYGNSSDGGYGSTGHFGGATNGNGDTIYYNYDGTVTTEDGDLVWDSSWDR